MEHPIYPIDQEGNMKVRPIGRVRSSVQAQQTGGFQNVESEIVLDAHFDQRAHAYTDVVLDEERLEASYRAVARFMVAAEEREPEWTPLMPVFICSGEISMSEYSSCQVSAVPVMSGGTAWM